jgi:hypothetical protein
MTVNFRVTLSLTEGATMSGCFVLMVSVPEDPDAVEVLVVVGEVADVDVVDEETSGIVRKKAPEMMRTITAKPIRALILGRFFSKQAHPPVPEFISFQTKSGFCALKSCSARFGGQR